MSNLSNPLKSQMVKMEVSTEVGLRFLYLCFAGRVSRCLDPLNKVSFFGFGLKKSVSFRFLQGSRAFRGTPLSKIFGITPSGSSFVSYTLRRSLRSSQMVHFDVDFDIGIEIAFQSLRLRILSLYHNQSPWDFQDFSFFPILGSSVSFAPPPPFPPQ